MFGVEPNCQTQVQAFLPTMSLNHAHPPFLLHLKRSCRSRSPFNETRASPGQNLPLNDDMLPCLWKDGLKSSGLHFYMWAGSWFSWFSCAVSFCTTCFHHFQDSLGRTSHHRREAVLCWKIWERKPWFLKPLVPFGKSNRIMENQQFVDVFSIC